MYDMTALRDSESESSVCVCVCAIVCNKPKIFTFFTREYKIETQMSKSLLTSAFYLH